MSRKLDFSKIESRFKGCITTREALKDVIPIPWSDDVLSGKRMVTIYAGGEKDVQGKGHNPD